MYVLWKPIKHIYILLLIYKLFTDSKNKTVGKIQIDRVLSNKPRKNSIHEARYWMLFTKITDAEILT
jgi:hypothetical protein